MEDRISRFSDPSSLAPGNRLISHPQASPSIRNNLRCIDQDCAISSPSKTLIADALEVENEYSGGDSDKGNPNSSMQVFNNLNADECKEGNADEMMEEMIIGALGIWASPQPNQDWRPAI